MCNADVGIITHNWIYDEKYSDPKTRPFPDFSVEKKCRDFDSILRWLEEDGGVKKFSSKFPMEYPPGAFVLPGDGYSVAGGKAF